MGEEVKNVAFLKEHRRYGRSSDFFILLLHSFQFSRMTLNTALVSISENDGRDPTRLATEIGLLLFKGADDLRGAVINAMRRANNAVFQSLLVYVARDEEMILSGIREMREAILFQERASHKGKACPIDKYSFLHLAGSIPRHYFGSPDGDGVKCGLREYASQMIEELFPDS